MTTATLRGLWRVLRPDPTARGGTAHVALHEGGVWSRRLRARSLRLTCCEGLLWLTREGDVRDTVLNPGDSVRLDGPGLVVVQALRPARFGAREGAPEPLALDVRAG